MKELEMEKIRGSRVSNRWGKQRRVLNHRRVYPGSEEDRSSMSQGIIHGPRLIPRNVIIK